MSTYAQATLIGRLGKDPEIRVSQSGKNIATFSLAVNTGYGDSKRTTWWNVVMFGKTAEAAERYLNKGDETMVIGEPSLEEWEDRDGNKRQTIKLTADRMVLMGTKDDGEKTKPAAPKKATDDAPFDDEIPF